MAESNIYFLQFGAHEAWKRYVLRIRVHSWTTLF